jgi:hypothetical protein
LRRGDFAPRGLSHPRNRETHPYYGGTETRKNSSDREGKTLPLIHGKPGQVNADNTDKNRNIGHGKINPWDELCKPL